MPDEERRKLTHDQKALPRVFELIEEARCARASAGAIGRSGSGGSSGGGDSADVDQLNSSPKTSS